MAKAVTRKTKQLGNPNSRAEQKRQMRAAYRSSLKNFFGPGKIHKLRLRDGGGKQKSNRFWFTQLRTDAYGKVIEVSVPAPKL